MDTRVTTSNDEAWAVLLNPMVYQKCYYSQKLKRIFYLTLVRLSETGRKSKRQEQICLLLTLYAFSRMSHSFLSQRDIQPQNSSFIRFYNNWVKLFIVLTWQMSSSLFPFVNTQEEYKYRHKAISLYTLLLKCWHCSKTLTIIFWNTGVPVG